MASVMGRKSVSLELQTVESVGCTAVAGALTRTRSNANVHRDQDGSFALVDGEIFGLDASDITPDAGQAHRLYRRLAQRGPEVLEPLRGAFSVAFFEAGSRTLSLITDPYGLRPLYYARTGMALVFASCMRSVLAGLPELPAEDPEGLADFLLLGMPTQQRTLYQGVELVPPGSVLTFRDGMIQVKPYVELIYGRTESTPQTLHGATNQLYEAFLDAGAELIGTPETFEVPLSGGLDSRMVAALAARFGRDVRTYTMGDADSADLQIGPSVARALALPNESVQVSPEDWIGWVQEAVHLTDGMYNPMDSQILGVAQLLDDPAAVALDGTSCIDGDFKFFHALAVRWFNRGASHEHHPLRVVPDAMVDASGRLTFPKLAQNPFIADALPRALASLDAMRETIPEGSRSSPFDAMDYMDHVHRVRRFNMMGTVLLRGFCEVRHPFFDPRVTKVVRSLRPLHRSKEKVALARVLRRLSPAVASIPYERTGMRADASLTRHTFRYAKVAADKLARRVLGLPERRMTSVIHYRAWCRSQPTISAFARDVISSANSESVQLLGRSTIEAVLDDCFAEQGSGATTFLIGRLLSHELWRKDFVSTHTQSRHVAE
jgi:hypothetical protein